MDVLTNMTNGVYVVNIVMNVMKIPFTFLMIGIGGNFFEKRLKKIIDKLKEILYNISK